MNKRRIELFLLVVAAAYPTLMAWIYFDVAAPPANGGQQASPRMAALYTGSKVLQFLLPVIAWRIFAPGRLRLPRPTWEGMGPAVVFGVLSLVGIAGVYFTVLKGHALLADMPQPIRTKIVALGIGTPAMYILFSLFVALIHAGFEEYFWRAYVFEGLRRHLSIVSAILLSALAFTGHHVIVVSAYQPNRFWTGVVPLSAGVFVGGAVWAWMYHRYRTIYPAWLSHTLIDVGIMIVGYDMAFGI